MLSEGEARGLHLEVTSRCCISRLHLDVASCRIPLWTRWRDQSEMRGEKDEPAGPRALCAAWERSDRDLIHA